LTEICNIQNHMTPVVQELFGAFLCSESNDPEKREYIDDGDQIREALLHDNYLSQKDIETCLGFDINAMAGDPDFPAIKTLFDAYVETFKP